LASRIKDQSGVAAILVGIVIVMLIGFTALAVDIGYVMTTRNELQNVADAAALAAARQLGAIYQGMSYDEQQDYVCDPSTIRPIARDVGLRNQAGRRNITINNVDIIIGQWDATSLTFTQTLVHPDAVQVTARRDSSANGPITTFFARILGIDTVNVTADATAALTGQGTSEPGELEIPIGISNYWFNHDYCNDEIKFYPTNDPESCAGWNTFTELPSNDITVRRILNEIITSPATTAGATEFSYIGGTLSNPTFDALLTLFQNKGYDVDSSGNVIEIPSGNPLHDATGTGQEVPLLDDAGNQLLYPDGTPRNKHLWETSVVVYAWDDCSNANTLIEIAGYARVKITDVLDAPDKLVKGEVICEYVSSEPTRGGGGEYGTMGSIPGLVE
jgi:hypothetical protein